MSSCVVDVWTFSLAAERVPVLSDEEWARARRFHFERDRAQWARARTGLRTILSQYLDCHLLEVHFAYGEHGKPATEGVEFNLSHAGGWAMVAVTRGVPVGIDLETIRDNVDIAKLLRRIGETDLPDSTIDLFHRWTRREATTKALGRPLMEVPAADVRVKDIDAPTGFAASVALAGAEPLVRYCGSV